MMCDICGKKKATVHLTEIVDKQMTEMHLCEECARQKSAQMEQQFGLADLLAGLSDLNKGTAVVNKESELVCQQCGLPYEEFRKLGRLGCGACYDSFKDHLVGLLKKIHGSSKHLGKMPMPLAPQGAEAAPLPPLMMVTQNIEELKRQLQQAIFHEDFEQAAMLRDQIKNLEKEH